MRHDLSRRSRWPLLSLGLAAALGLAPLTVQAQEDDSIPGESYHWQVQARALYVHPMNQHLPLDVNLDGAVAGELVGEALFLPRWSAELAVASPENLDGKGSPVSVRLLTQTLTVKYYFPEVGVAGMVPYIGTGLYHATASQTSDSPTLGVRNPGFGWVLQAGFTYGITPDVFISADVRYLDNLEPELIVDGGGSGHIGIDPIVASIGVGLRF